jgi:hypothetical protein
MTLHSPYICVSFALCVIVLVVYLSCPVLSSLHSLYICAFYNFCQCPCSLPVFSCPDYNCVPYTHYMSVSFPISIRILALYTSCPVLSSFPILIVLFLLQFLSAFLFFTRHVLSCRLCPLQICIYVPFNVSTILGLKPSSCPVVFALSLKFCFFYYLCHCPLFLTISFCPVFFACFFLFLHIFTFFNISPQ